MSLGLGLGLYAGQSSTDVECWNFGQKCWPVVTGTCLMVRFTQANGNYFVGWSTKLGYTGKT